eukprot:g6885.t1
MHKGDSWTQAVSLPSPTAAADGIGGPADQRNGAAGAGGGGVASDDESDAEEDVDATRAAATLHSAIDDASWLAGQTVLVAAMELVEPRRSRAARESRGSSVSNGAAGGGGGGGGGGKEGGRASTWRGVATSAKERLVGVAELPLRTVFPPQLWHDRAAAPGASASPSAPAPDSPLPAPLPAPATPGRAARRSRGSRAHSIAVEDELRPVLALDRSASIAEEGDVQRAVDAGEGTNVGVGAGPVLGAENEIAASASVRSALESFSAPLYRGGRVVGVLRGELRGACTDRERHHASVLRTCRDLVRWRRYTAGLEIETQPTRAGAPLHATTAQERREQWQAAMATVRVAGVDVVRREVRAGRRLQHHRSMASMPGAKGKEAAESGQ